jgi:predicted AAA+ superfamily ATPase
VKRGELETQLAITNQWWRRAAWRDRDRDLRRVAEAPFVYKPDPLGAIEPPGLYMLLGPRRVGKSVEIKRKVAQLLDGGVAGRRIFHAACDGWRAGDLGMLLSVADEMARPDDGPRYFFLDEITGVSGDWVSQLKWLRDNTAMDADCIVVSGSSNAELENARKALAGRRGAALASRTLLPMGFTSFCHATGVDLPAVEPLRPQELLQPRADAAINDLRVYLNDLVVAWERYLRVGGMPRAVSDWVKDREISQEFVNAIWDVIHGDAMAGEDWGEMQTEILLDYLGRSTGSFLKIDRAARDVGAHHGTIRRRLARLQHSYIAWPCYRISNGQPEMKAANKLYFVDPLHAQLNHLRASGRPAPDFTQLTEQQLGLLLLAAHEHEWPGTFSQFRAVMYEITSTRREIDFVGPWLQDLPYEGKYTEGAWLREAQTAATAYSGRCVLATRNVVERRDDRRAVAAGILGLLLDNRTEAVG